MVVRAINGVNVTIGNDAGTAAALASMGGQHTDHNVDECHVDTQNRVVTAPAYMIDTGIAQVATGIEAAVGALISMA